jgi:hypothetical protein
VRSGVDLDERAGVAHQVRAVLPTTDVAEVRRAEVDLDLGRAIHGHRHPHTLAARHRARVVEHAHLIEARHLLVIQPDVVDRDHRDERPYHAGGREQERREARPPEGERHPGDHGGQAHQQERRLGRAPAATALAVARDGLQGGLLGVLAAEPRDHPQQRDDHQRRDGGSGQQDDRYPLGPVAH